MEACYQDVSFDEALSQFLECLEPRVTESINNIQKPSSEEVGLWFATKEVN